MCGKQETCSLLFFFGGKWKVEEIDISFLEEN